MKWLRAIMIIMLAGIALGLTGCGGSGASGTGASRGQLRLQVEWPSSTRRALPVLTQRLMVTVSNGSGFSTTQTAARPADGLDSEVSFPGLPVGTVTVTINAYDDPAQPALATAVTTATIRSDELTTVHLDLQSTIAALTITPAPSTLNEGATQLLVATARNSDGDVVAVAPDGIFWQSLNPEIASIDQYGVLTGIASGSATIKAVERESGITATFTLTVASLHGGLVLQIIDAPVVVGVIPGNATLAANGTQLFAATVIGSENQQVIWTVQEADGGTIDSEGFYTAPAAPGSYHVVATSTADSSATAMATVTVTAVGYQFSQAWGSAGAGDGQFSNLGAIALDNSGSVYVTDRGNRRVQRFETAGPFLLQWSATGTEDQGLAAVEAKGIAADFNLDRCYVSDAVNHRVKVYTLDGTLVAVWGSSAGAGNRQFNTPCGIAIDAAGNVYVADSGNDRIQKFTSDGAFLAKWGTSGTGNGQFTAPWGIAVDPAGNVFVSELSGNRVQKFTSNGSYLTQWSHGLSNPMGVATDTFGNVYVVDSSNNRIQKFTNNGAFATQWGSLGTGDGQFTAPMGIAVDTVGTVYVTDTGNNRVQTFVAAE